MLQIAMVGFITIFTLGFVPTISVTTVDCQYSESSSVSTGSSYVCVGYTQQCGFSVPYRELNGMILEIVGHRTLLFLISCFAN